MIKRGDKGTVYAMKARVIDADLKGEESLAIAVTDKGDTERVITRKQDGSSIGPEGPFIPSKPWDSLKPMDVCFVRSNESTEWRLRIYASEGKDGYPQVFTQENEIITWDQCVPAKLIGGELIPVEES